MAFPGGPGQWQSSFQSASSSSDAANRDAGAMQGGPFEQHINPAAPGPQVNLFGVPMTDNQQNVQHHQAQHSEHELQFGGQDDMDTTASGPNNSSDQNDSDRTRMNVSDPSMWAIASDSDLVQKLEAQEEQDRLKLRKQEDLDDVSLALALQLQQEEEARMAARQNRKPLPPLFTGPESDNIDIFVCVDRELQPDLPKAPKPSSLTSPPKGPANPFFAAGAFPAAPPPSSSSSPPLPMSVFPQPPFGIPNAVASPSAGTGSFSNSAGVLFGHDAAYFGAKGAAAGLSPDVNIPLDEDEAEEDEDEIDSEELRAVTVNRFSTVAQVMQSIVKSDVFPIRKVSHIRHIAFRAVPVPPESLAPQGSGHSPMTSFQAPVFGTVFNTPANNTFASGDTEMMNTGESGEMPTQRPDEFMILPTKMKISDLPITEDSVFKVVLRKRDRNRKRKRVRGGRNGSSSNPNNRDDLEDFNEGDLPPSNSLEQVSEAELWKQRFLEMQAKLNKVEERAATLEADLVMEKLPRLHLPESKRNKAQEDSAAEQQMHTFNIPTLASNPAPSPSAPKVIPRAFALPDSVANVAPPSLPLHNTPVDKPDVNKPHHNNPNS